MSGSDPYFFGYGSLVNRATHDFARPERAKLHGWRREWRHTDLRPVAFLTAVPDPDCSIDGLIAQVPGADWDALDEREWAYDRIPASHTVSHNLDRDIDIAVYAVPQNKQNDPSDKFPIILSYVDVVIQGYLREFGEDGVTRFFETTSGWDTTIVDDRAAPRYPRHQQLTPEQTALVDSHLADLPARVTPDWQDRSRFHWRG